MSADREEHTPKEFIPGTKLIEAERERQIAEEGYDSDHDADHDGGELSDAAACYACAASAMIRGASAEELCEPIIDGYDWMLMWPFDAEWFKLKPDDPIRNLVKAGALLAAEIDRLQRQLGTRNFGDLCTKCGCGPCICPRRAESALNKARGR